jgi:hypothetical protein
MSVTLRLIREARVTARALAVIVAALQREAVHVAISLAVRIVTAGTRHGAVSVARAVRLVLLVREGAHATVRVQRLIAEYGELCGVVLLEGLSGEVARLQLILE